MNRMLKWTMGAIIAFSFGSASAQVTGRTVLNNNTNAWQPGTYAGSPEVSTLTGTFHAGGVAACDGCHVMHNASGGQARSTRVAPWTNAVPAFLLQGSDQSSTCLMCHGGTSTGTVTDAYLIANTVGNLAGMNYSPGGDFGWLVGASARYGHNVVALDFGMAADGSMPTAPGGSFQGGTGISAFACSNCHDPHGRFRMQYASATTWTWAGPTAIPGMTTSITQPIYSSGSYGMLPTANAAVGSYRLLAGVGYTPASNTLGAFPFVNNPPVAVAPSSYNHTEQGSKANKSLEVRVAYGAGMSEWCQNCHSNIHLDNYTSGAMGGTGLRHPTGNGAALKPGQYNVYNTYVSSGRFDGTGDQYTSLVPFENAAKVGATTSGGTIAGITSLRNAAAGSDTAGIFVASAQSNVMCLSCHRAHASAFPSMLRWNMDDTFITNSSATQFVDTATPARGNAVLQRGYYGRLPSDFGMYQRSMCNKCHGKD